MLDVLTLVLVFLVLLLTTQTQCPLLRGLWLGGKTGHKFTSVAFMRVQAVKEKFKGLMRQKMFPLRQ